MLRCPRTGVLIPTGHAARDGALMPGGGTVSVLCPECQEHHRGSMSELVLEPDAG